MVSVSRLAGARQFGQLGFQEGLPDSARGERPLPGELDVQGQQHRQVCFGHRDGAAVVAVDDRDGRAPVALARDAPVPEAVVASVRLPWPSSARDDRRSSPCRARFAMPLKGPELTRSRPPRRPRSWSAGIESSSLGLDHHPDRQAVLLGEFEVPLVMGRNGHDRPGAVFHEDEVGRQRWAFSAGQRIEAVSPGKDPFLLLISSALAASSSVHGTFSKKRRTVLFLGGPFRQDFRTRGCSGARLMKVAP